ncbi:MULTISPECIES: cell division protein ZapA [Ralstonia solanacearum species complex]|uniref:Cell division protein ZapA n=5 Tax=Ralstonia solanacearum TaxID=305 RepID=A0ABF7RAQ6_RALSL|nr:cell division protein ZapA [Ralstonia solanacearum]AEG68345.1 cell division protein zapa [Ralstonia solanacearum Po82]ALF88809.1 Cell division protein ZapA [Ralstonia solanacearum]AMP69626.1 cell division protein ZapA [Ralstonia solanacearum]AMP73467.1 cell division protein ZapA [Ralstonia solanacearum]AST32872.2 cell division protein ZapA [Ralstonia solanacearum]
MSSKQIEVNIAGQAYKFAVSTDNEAALREAAAMVDTQMMRIRNGTATKGIERVAVMAAISIASDLLAIQRQAAADAALPIDAIRAKLSELNARADEALRQYGEVA